MLIDIANALGRQMGRKVEIRLLDWDGAQQMVLQGKADALLQLAFSEDRDSL
jgi:ABC-type amino acid transport substrate-binding protein